MSLNLIHSGLANTAVLFIAILGVWAVFLRIRARSLDGAWYGAAMLGELLLVAQAVIGVILYFQGYSGALQRPFLHILYGVVAILTLPAAYAYFGQLENENVKTVAMAVSCIFLWGILQRANQVVYLIPQL
ncbi:MAG: hypothetical protein WDZ49_16960 [Litorilinea sp.]